MPTTSRTLTIREQDVLANIGITRHRHNANIGIIVLRPTSA